MLKLGVARALVGNKIRTFSYLILMICLSGQLRQNTVGEEHAILTNTKIVHNGCLREQFFKVQSEFSA